ncbi:hypothetical protein P3T76_015840 [Phytophthora citrophthora]|uniref:Uncharacterized protein n=1 Tax=Phytophthora citrophthora TaxID=4793 RepID=A0AAD9FZA9_9STRA|nr:hypothetical protein P3T76_015813 [Phytophthora citrophthora]KAK1928715.1 hypothetical protein P3T76_015818 [Phytophthora citrophthora]KAK1928721.1 hypothetical protein P3T76_015824 [Phytophthora citrophthora]KAK1928737.1 hypothetical protein P3T76_015840 [Phytophthora citrophthora]
MTFILIICAMSESVVGSGAFCSYALGLLKLPLYGPEDALFNRATAMDPLATGVSESRPL